MTLRGSPIGPDGAVPWPMWAVLALEAGMVLWAIGLFGWFLIVRLCEKRAEKRWQAKQ